jgi:hypothetical protein
MISSGTGGDQGLRPDWAGQTPESLNALWNPGGNCG